MVSVFEASDFLMKSTAGKHRDKRIERDSMGEVLVPAHALYGAQTQRALENFPISNLRFPREFNRAMGLIKLAAAGTVAQNREKLHANSHRPIIAANQGRGVRSVKCDGRF